MSKPSELHLVECPRDAMQGIHDFIPTDLKVDYINAILKCDFDTVDFGSFVSPKAIPQMSDSAEVLEKLDASPSKLLAIIANEKGADQALQFDRIDYLGYPFSVSEEFQRRNTNAGIEESFARLSTIQDKVQAKNKELVVYLSMGFGNPYGEHWHPDIVADWSAKLHNRLGIKILALSDTIGAATPESVASSFETLIQALPQVTFGAHLHTTPENARKLVDAAFRAGCRRFDGAIKGFGGCPMAKDDLTGNMPTEVMLDYFGEKNITTRIHDANFAEAMQLALRVFA